MSTYRFSTMTMVGALALLVSAASANAAQSRDGRNEKGTGHQAGSGRSDASNSTTTNATRRGTAENHRGGATAGVPTPPRVTPPTKPVVVVKHNDGWRDGNGAHGSEQSYQVRRYNDRDARYHQRRFDGPQAFEQHGSYRLPPRHRRHWWSRYW